MTLPQMLTYETKNFIAIRLPENDSGGEFYETMTPVNIFRTVFNRYFNTTYERLEDRTYYSDYARPYRFTDITDALKEPDNSTLWNMAKSAASEE